MLDLPAWFRADGLVLRPPTTADVGRIAEICQDPEIQHFTRVPVPYDSGDAESFVTMATAGLEQGTGAHLLVEHHGDVIGCVGASIDPSDRVAVVGYWTAPEARRRGFTTTAVRRLCKWLLEDVGMARVEIDAAANNDGSNALAERLGFRLEGTRRSAMHLSATVDLPAERADVNDRGLLPGELRRRRAPRLTPSK